MRILDCAPNVMVADVAHQFPGSDVFVLPGDLQLVWWMCMSSFLLLWSVTAHWNWRPCLAFLKCILVHVRILLCARADTWLWNMVDVVQALLNARSKQGNVGQDCHIGLGVVLWCDAKYMGEEWSFFKLHLFAPDLNESGVSLDALIGATRGHESAFLNVRLALFDLQSAFRAKFSNPAAQWFCEHSDY
jgi:hypothetical protein